MRVPFLRLAAAGLLVLAVAAPASAAGGRTEIAIQAGASGSEPFWTVSGSFCPSGGAVTTDFRFGGGSNAGSFHLHKTLTCANGAGTLTIDVNAATVFGSPQDQGGWSVVSGTGLYARAHGGGNLVGSYNDQGIEDHYTGVLLY